MATLAEAKRNLTHGLEEQKARIEKVRSDDIKPEVKTALMAEIKAAEVSLASIRNDVVEMETTADQLRRIQEDLDKMHEGKSSVPFDVSAEEVLDYERKTAKGPQSNMGMSFGERVVNSDAYKNFSSRLDASSSNGSDRVANMQFDMNEFKSSLAAFSPQQQRQALQEMEAKTVGTFTSSGLTTNIEMLPGTFVLGTQPLRVANLFTEMQTTSPVIRYLRENSFTNDAAWRLEEGLMAQTGSDVVPVDADVKNLGVFEKVTEENLLDYPFVSSYLNARLPLKVLLKEDSDLLNGTGGAAITGILHTSGVLQHALGYDVDETTAVSGDTPIDAILRASARVNYQSFFAANAVIMNPFDWMNIRMTRVGTGDAEGGANRGLYQFGQPSQTGLETLWGLPVVQTTFLPVGTAVVGAFNIAGAIARRQGLVTDITNSNDTDFMYRRVTIRLTERLAFPLFQPQALCVVNLVAAGSGSGSG